MDAALLKPFTAKTGIEIVNDGEHLCQAEGDGGSQCGRVGRGAARLHGGGDQCSQQGLLEKLDYGVINKTDLITGAAHEFYLQMDVVAACMRGTPRM